MSQKNYIYELEKFLKEYGHNEELSILTACQKASMHNAMIKSADQIDWESLDSDNDYDEEEDDYDFQDSDYDGKKVDIPSGFCDSWAYTGSSIALTLIGLFPGVGIPFDIGNGLLNIYCGDYVYALLSFISAIPAVGYVGNALKAVFAGLKGTVKGGPALVKIMSGVFKGTKAGKQLAFSSKRGAALLDEMTEITKALRGTSDDMAKLVPENLRDLGSAEEVLKALHSVKDSRRIKEVAAFEKKVSELRKIEDSISASKQIIKNDWDDFTKSFFEVFNGSGQFSKMLGIPNKKIRSFMRWTKDIFYLVEEQIIGIDDAVRQVRVAD